MKTFFVQIGCELGKTYEVANNLVEKFASEIYSIADPFDIIAKFHVENSLDIGKFVSDNIHSLNMVRKT